MGKIRQIEQLVLRSRRIMALVIALALAVLAGVVALSTLQVRQSIRAQIVGRDGGVLHAVALLHYTEDLAEEWMDPDPDPGEQLSIVLMSANRIAQLRGVLGLRLFDAAGEFVESFPPAVTEQVLPREHYLQLRQLRPVSRFHDRAPLAGMFYPDDTTPTGTIPVLEVFVPLHEEDGPLVGIAQFLVEGHSIAAEYARLDRNLAWQGLTAFAAGGTILTMALIWAFRRLQRAQSLLSERTENLLQANQELALAAKTSALGAVAAHLIHGLKNPLAGLQNFVVTRGAVPESGGESDWQHAVASTRRMQAMITQVVGVLHEEQEGSQYEVTLAEVEALVRQRVQPLAHARGVDFTSLVPAATALPNRVANLIALILTNLAENAVQATAAGRRVALSVNRVGTRLAFAVRDEGPGFPADTPLFMPCRSSRDGGSGIGLALCKQLANHLGAELELTSSTSAGCIFTLWLPEAARTKSAGRVRQPVQDEVRD